MLTGYDNSLILVPIETNLDLKQGNPFATETALGWCIVDTDSKSNTADMSAVLDLLQSYL